MNVFQINKLVCCSFLTIAFMSSSCGDYLEYPIGTKCYDEGDLSLAESITIPIKQNYKLSGAWRIEVDQHKLGCNSSLVAYDDNFEYKALRSRVFFLETIGDRIYYVPSKEEGMKNEEGLTDIGAWVENKPLVLDLPFKNDDLSEDSLKVDTLRLYVSEFTTGIGELSGQAHYIFNENSVVMTGEFTLLKVSNN
jgi:hypothetical protein